MVVVRALVLSTLAVSTVTAQIFRRTAACPNLGCVFPPDQADFFAGQAFDIRLEIQAPLNGSEAFNNGVPIVDGYTFKIGGRGGEMVDATQFFGIEEPENEPYNFTYYEDLVSQDAKNTTLVNVIAKSFRNIALYNPGLYDVEFTYNGGQVTRATWEVRELATCRKAKNVILFVGDGMTQSMITAARLLAHKTIGGKYMSKMTMDMAPAIGLQMTHSLDSFITDSANSASALMGGKKSTVNALNAYQDSTGKPFGDPKYETIFEAFRRVYGGQVGAVSTAFIADATPAATVAHTSQRSQYTAIIEQYLNGVTANYSWFDWQGIDVLFGAGAENFLPGPGNGNVSQFERWQEHGYSLSLNKTELDAIPNDQRALGLFCQANLPTWLDRNVYKSVLDSAKLPRGGKGTYDLPSLTDMTLKAIDILSTRSKNNGDTGFMLMSEAASIDKQMHSLDYHRSLGELLELDATVNATLRHLEEIGELDNTLVVVTADHGHGFDVFGTADTEYLRAQEDDREKRNAIGIYENSGLSAYQVPPGVNPQNDTIFVGEQGPNFPVNWDPRYVIAAGTAAFPDHKEDYSVNKTAPRTPAVKGDANTTDGGYFYNPADAPKGLYLTGNLPGSAAQGVHSLTDVPIFAWGPGHELFRGVLNSPDVALTLAIALDLGRTSNVTSESYKR